MSDFHFLFREDKGKISRAVWWKAVLGLASVWGAILALYVAVARGDITKVGLTAMLTIGTIMIGVCFYFVSAKRFQDLNKPGTLALVLPALILADAAIHWMQPRLGATFPDWLSFFLDGVTIAIALWNIWVLGFRESVGP